MTRRLRVLLFVAFFAAFTPFAAHAANLPLLSPGWAIVPTECQSCPCGYGGVFQTIQNVMNAGVSLSVIIMVLAITYAGFLFLSSPTNPENRNKAKGALSNAVIGMIIVLAAWVIVDFIMKLFYGGQFGPWNSIIAPASGTGSCIQAVQTQKLFNGTIASQLTSIPGSPGSGDGGTGTSVGGSATGACDPNAILSAASAAGVSVSQQEANILACVAGPESSCGTVMQNYNWGKGSSAYGPFQIVLQTNAKFFENQVCYQAAGVSGPLNCQNGFSGGNPIPGSPIVQNCMNAAANFNCSVAAADGVYDTQQPPLGKPWIADSHSQKQQECLNKYGGG